MTIVYTQNFESTAVGSLPSGFANIINTWTVTATNPISGSNSLMASVNDGAVVLETGLAAIANMDLRYDVGVQDGFVGAILRSDAAGQNHYMWAINAGTDYTTPRLFKNVSGSYIAIGTYAGQGYLGTVTAGTKLSIRARIVGANLYFRVWQFGTSEPGSWNVTVSDSSITAAGYFGFRNQLGSANTGLTTIDNLVVDDTNSATATDFTFTPSSQTTSAGTPTAPYSINLNGEYSANVTIILSDGGAGGTFNPTSLNWTNASIGPQPFTYTPTGGTTPVMLTATASGAFSTNHTASCALTAATDFTVTPSSQVTLVGLATGNYTLTANGLPASSTTVTLSDSGQGGTFTPSSLTLATAAARTFTYTPASSGTKTLTASATGGFTASHTVGCVASAEATDFTLMPSSLSTSPLLASGSYIVTLNGALGSNETIALTDASGGGIFTPSSLTFTPANAGTPQTFSYTPASGAAGTTKTLTATGGGAFSANHSASCVVSATASDFSLTPSSLSTNPAVATSNYTVTLNGPLSANETIVLSDASGGGTFTPSSLTFTSGNAATPQTFTYTPSGGAGGTTKTLTATGSGAFSANHSASCVVSSGPQVVPVTNSAIFWSEGNWDRLTSGTFGVSVDTMQATAAGAYFKFNVSGTVNLSLGIDNSTTSSFPSGNMPIVSYIIDAGDRVDSQLQPSVTNFAISSSLSTGTHTVEVYLRSTSLNQGDRWGSIGISPTNVLRIKGIVIDSAATISTPTLRSKRMVIYGDSRTECYNLEGSSQDYPVNGYGALMARALDAEWANVGYGSQGVTVVGAGNVPGMLTSYNLYSAGRPRFATGVDYVTVLQGFNDNSNSVGTATIQTDVQALLVNLRTLYGANTRIFWFYDPAGFYASNYAAAVAAYRTANPSDAKVYYIDISADAPVPAQFDQFSGATDYTADGVHFNQFGSGVLGAQYAAKIQTALGTNPTTPSHQLKRARS